MDDAEIVKRVVAVLTETSAWVHEDDESEDDVDSMTLVGQFTNELMRAEISVPGDASPQEVATAVATALTPVVGRTLGAFASAFHQLAYEHDRTDPEVTSVQVLRDLALRAEQQD